MTPRILGLLAALALTFAACGEDGGGDTDTTITDTDTTPPACGGELGSDGCECRSDGTCDAGLVCNGGVCEADTVVTTGLVLPAGARGCEILLREDDGTVGSVTFADTVRGTFIRESPHVAVTLVANTDADFAAGAVQIEGTGTTPAVVVSSKCVDAAGAELADAPVVIQ